MGIIEYRLVLVAQLASSTRTEPRMWQKESGTISNNETTTDVLPISSDRNDSDVLKPTCGDSKKHQVHNVLKIASQATIVKWMLSEVALNVEKRIAWKDGSKVYSFFSIYSNANMTREMRLWKSPNVYEIEYGTVDLRGTNSTVTRVTHAGSRKVQMKECKGGGRKRSAWVADLNDV